MQDLTLVKNINGEVYTDSKLIADKFGKKHKHVIDTIESLASEISDTKLFIESTYRNRGKEYKCYLVSETGLQLYLFNIQGFVNEKLEYINQFNQMKQMITDLQLGKPEAIISLLTWKNDNMETTIRTYVNGGNVLNVIPAIVDECKRKVENGEMKIRVISTIIRTLEDMGDNEPIIGNRDNFATAVLETNHKLRHIQNTRLGGMTKANNDLKHRIDDLKNERYSTDDYLDYVDGVINNVEYKILSETIDDYVGYIAKHKFNGSFKDANNYIYKIYENRTGNKMSKYTKEKQRELGVTSKREALYVVNPQHLDSILLIAINEAKALGYVVM